MIKVLFGENIVSSRKALAENIEDACKKKIEIIHLDGEKLTPTDLILALESGSLFKKNRLVIIEKIFSLPGSKNKETLIGLLIQNKENNILIWEDRKIPLEVLVKYSNEISFQQFRLSSFLFNFLDELSPGQTKKNLANFHKTLEHEDPQMVFSMLVRLIRFLILAKEGEESLKGLVSWQKRKYISQAKNFNSQFLKDCYQKLLDLDYNQKTSQTSLDLSFSLDLLISEI